MEWNSKILLFGLILTYMVVPIVEAHDELTMNISLRPYSRVLYVDYSFGDEKYSSSDKIIDTAIETKSDTIMFYPGFADFLAMRYGKDVYNCNSGTCVRFNESQMKYLISAAHARNISIWLAVNPIEIKSTDGIKQWLQEYVVGRYEAQNKDGGYVGGSGYHGFEPGYLEPLAKRVEMYKWVFQNFDFQGLYYEEPVIADISYGPNFDCAQKKVGNWTKTATPTPIQKWALLKCREEAYTEMYRQIHDNISSLGVKYSYPYFTIATGGVYTSYINGSISGGNSMIYSTNLTDLYSKGYIDGHFPATIAPYSSTTNMRNDLVKIRDTFNNATTAGMMVAIVNTASDRKPCPNLYDLINIVENSSAPYVLFHRGYLNVTATFQGSLVNNIARTCSGYSFGDTVPSLAKMPRTWLSEHPPSHPRLFNPLTRSSTSINVTVPQPTTNVINNPDFESGTTSWTFFTNGNGTFSASSPGFNGTKTAILSLNSNGTNIQLYQNVMTLEPGTYYQLSFAAYSTSGHDLRVNLIKHISP